MQPQEPSWKIRSRPCPFYSQGKCFFSKNCCFLHDAKSTPTVIRVTAPDDEDDVDLYHNVADTGVSTQRASLPDHPQILSDSDEDSSDEEDSGLDSPTIRKPVLSHLKTEEDGVTTEAGPSRDSVVTVRGESNDPDTTTSSTSRSLPKFDAESRRESPILPSHSFMTRSRQGSAIQSLPPFLESSIGSSVSTPSSATSATAQELEVPSSASLPIIPNFSLANAASSSLLTNRLAKSREIPLSLSPVPVEVTREVPTTPFSPGALYASYQDDDAVPASPFVDTIPETASPEPISPTSQVGTKTPSWLRPLRLTSTLTPQTELQSSASFNSISQQFTYNASQSQSLPSLSTRYSVSPETLYDSPVTRESPEEFYHRSPYSLNHMAINTPHTIVLSDYSGYVSPLTLSRNGSIDIDTSHFPRLPASPESKTHGSSSSQASNTFSELIGRSPRKRPVVPRIRTLKSQQSEGKSQRDAAPPEERTSTSAEQFQSALERRAKRIREKSSIIPPSDCRNGVPDSCLTLDSQSHRSEPATLPDFSQPSSWSTLPHISMLSDLDTLPVTSFSGSLLMQQVQSSPPRASPSLRPFPSSPSTISPLSQDARKLPYAPSPDPSPRPDLLFAIASDQPAEVERLLSSGGASANETTGAGTGLLEFTVANEGLKNKTEMVKTLLKYGADPGPLAKVATADPLDGSQSPILAKKIEEAMNPAMKYYLTRPKSLDVDSKPALEALQKSSFAPLARARFDIIGQDRALDEFYRVLGMQSQRKGRNALVILLCGASGHGKSLLAQKVGSLLDVHTHTINMTALRSQHDLWQCLSTGIDDASPDLDLSEFLVENQGRRCVVVLDEIEKVDDAKSLNPLLLPWDIGRCSLEQKKHTDTSKVIWIATSNLGQQLIAEHVAEWGHPDSPPTRAEYTQLATAVRRRIADVLGASLLSRVTAILPFLPFTEVEKIAIGTEAALSHAESLGAPLSSAEMEEMVKRAVKDVNFVEEEGARSLQRVVETHLSMRT